MTELYAPPSFWRLTPEQVEAETNGCGSRGIGGYLVPDTVWGLSITPACNIHDWMYHIGETLEDKDRADRVFLNNIVRLIDDNTRWGWLRALRLVRARTYYEAVSHFGGPAFWAGKNEPEELGHA